MTSILAALLLGPTAHAIPAQFTHQGRLLDAEGVPLDGEATITFRVTNDETGGDELWEETITLPLTNGFYSVVLGADDEANPLDTDVLSQAPVWLELQLDGEPAMFPRSPINAVPYATLATVAEEVSGGPVDASEIAVSGTPVVNEAGEWVGPTPTVSWSDIEGMPDDFADGVDDDTDTDSFAELGTSCLDGDTPVWDSISAAWACDMDQDSLADIACTEGQLISWGDDATGWVCADDIDTYLTEEDVDAMVSDNGYAMASEIFSSSFLDLVDLAPGLADGDDDTQLTPEEVDAIVADNGYAMATDVFSGSYSDLSDRPALFDGDFSSLTGVPDGLADGDDNTQLTPEEVDAIVADNGYAMASDVFGGSYSDLTDTPTLFDGDFSSLTGVPDGLADGDDDTQLTPEEVDAIVAENGYALDSELTSEVAALLDQINTLQATVDAMVEDTPSPSVSGVSVITRQGAVILSATTGYGSYSGVAYCEAGEIAVGGACRGTSDYGVLSTEFVGSTGFKCTLYGGSTINQRSGFDKHKVYPQVRCLSVSTD